MRYRTLIEIITDAENEHEAVDLAGEFLRGNIENGVEMRFRVKPYRARLVFPVAVTLFFVMIAIGSASAGYIMRSPSLSCAGKNVNAIQPPLKTDRPEGFKKTWKEEENKKVLDYIKN